MKSSVRHKVQARYAALAGAYWRSWALAGYSAALACFLGNHVHKDSFFTPIPRPLKPV